MEFLRPSWQLFTASVSVVRRTPRLFLPAALSLISMAILGVVIFVPAVVATANADPADEAPGAPLAVAFVGFLIAAILVNGFFNAALVSCTLDGMRGQRVRLGAGFARAAASLPAVVPFSLLSALVTLVATALARAGEGDNDSSPAPAILLAILGAVIGTAWFFGTFLALPLIVDERIGTAAAIRRSVELLKRTWGAQLASGVGLGLVGLVLLLPGFAFTALAVPATDAGNDVIAYVLIAVTFAWFVAAWVLTAALGQIYRAAIYVYATEHVVPAGYEEALLLMAFRGPRRLAPADRGGTRPA